MTHRYVLIADTATVIDHVVRSLPAGLVAHHPLGDLAELATQSTSPARVYLVEWSLQSAIAFGDVCRLLMEAPSLVIALVSEPGASTLALTAGADTFHPLPLSPDLLLAQVLAHERLVRRSPSMANSTSETAPQPISFGGVKLDLESGTVNIGGQEVMLPARQAEVLICLLRNAGCVVSRQQLLSEAWRWDFLPGTNVVDVYVHYVRRALALLGAPDAIETVRGRGYRFWGVHRGDGAGAQHVQTVVLAHAGS